MIDLYDGLKYGVGVFETIRVSGGKPQYLDKHIQRMKQGMNLLKMNVDNIEEQLSALVFPIGGESNAIRLTAVKHGVHNDLYIEQQYRENAERQQKKPFEVLLSNCIRDKNNPVNSIKSNNYLSNVLLYRDAISKGYSEVIFLNQDEMLAEGSMSNLFFIQNATVFTPSISSGILPGVFRYVLIEYLRQNNVVVVERDIHISDIEDMHSCFITNSLMGSRSVSSITDTKRGEIYKFSSTPLLDDIISLNDIL